MNLQEIKTAVDEGKTVCWSNPCYQVRKGKSDYFIICTMNNDCIGLTWTDGVTMNGEEKDFYILEVKS